MAILLLHSVPGFCAMADVLCVEANGHISLEKKGDPCASLEQHQPCADFAADDAHEGHHSASAPQLDMAALASKWALALPFFLPIEVEPERPLLYAAGPPAKSFALILRATTILLI